MEKRKQNVLILASGAGTRNAMFTYNNALPKCLMSVGDKTCIETLIDIYQKLGVAEIYIALQNRHVAVVKEVLDFRGYDGYTIVSFEQTASPMMSLSEAFNRIPDYQAYDWYINWSDAFTTAMKHVDTGTIFCDLIYRHRNLAYMHKSDNHSNFAECKVVTTADSQGNVPGIFFVEGYKLQSILSNHDDSTDFDVQFADNYDCSIVIRHNIVDIGDYNKYSSYMQLMKSDNTCRYFNELKVNKTTVEKRPKTEYGLKLHEIEYAYYRRYSGKAKALAKLLGYDEDTHTMTLERIKGQTCQSLVDEKITSQQKLSEANRLIKEFLKAIDTFHAIKNVNIIDSNDDIREAIVNEFYIAIDKRVTPCKVMIEQVMLENDIKSIDGMALSTYNDMMEAVKAWLDKKLEQGYFEVGITHGDPNTDNTMYSTNGIRFVDPRGYFGKLKTLGLGVTQYDIAKFVYGFSGYGQFNSAEFIATKVVDGDLQVYVGIKERQSITDVNLFDMKHIDDDIRILVGIIWVKLTSYIINDPAKSVAAYLYGNALLTKLLNIRHI